MFSYSSIRRCIRLLFVLILGFIFLGSSSLPPGDRLAQARAYTRGIEFDYIGWVFKAWQIKINQFALGAEKYLAGDVRKQIVLEYLELVARTQQLESQINLIYADPNILNPTDASRAQRRQLEVLLERRARVDPVAEGILQSQIAEVVAELGLAMGGQPVPPVLYRGTPLPKALIISPRYTIRADLDISIIPDLTIEEHAELEDRIDQALDVSSLMVNIGGVGLYPTMVYQTSNLEWLSEVVAHEWVHNFLTLRPLGVNYLTSPELRTINETTASIAGKEIGLAVLERFYPELVPEPAPPPPLAAETAQKPQAAPVFEYYAEMRQTRVTVDRLLEEGKIEEAEEYMRQRRVVFWENGYRHLRKLNQAYFAFYGAYADHPEGGAAGEDPVGAAVRTLRAQSSSLAEFVKRISWISSFGQLQQAVDELTH